MSPAPLRLLEVMRQQLMAPKLVNPFPALSRQILTNFLISDSKGRSECFRLAEDAKNRHAVCAFGRDVRSHCLEAVWILIEVEQQDHSTVGILAEIVDKLVLELFDYVHPTAGRWEDLYLTGWKRQ